MVSHHLNNLDFNNFNIDTFSKENDCLTVKTQNIALNKNLYLIKYNKNELKNNLSNSKFRSVIISDSNIISFSPPKSVDFNIFSQNNDPSECYAEDFIDGTMINLFYCNDNWEISTKSSIGGNVNFFINENTLESKDKTTFKTMFLECCKNANLNIENLEKSFSYTFVIQHPENRIVTPIMNTQLFCIKIYSFLNNVVNEVPFEYFYNNYSCFQNTYVYIPMRYPINSYDELMNYYGSENTPYYCVGIMIYNKIGERTKIRNPNYEIIRKLRGNQPKLQYQYFCLRKENKVREFLNYYPEHKQSFYNYKCKMHEFTAKLYANYKECFIFKLKGLKDYDFQYKIHMYNIHKIYLEKLKPENNNISKTTIIDYVNNLHPAQQMFAINYNLRIELNTQKVIEQN
uniref:Uncharacterized protein n=1 Tax=Nucleocytoviricota sp. TaxID=2809609 RepID=A0A9E8G4B1_9VIRU|nr:hypothetical protein [Nucleocytoviricota sp.]UZT29119.1 hypothetical protein [Nucleocytoviricota sp.]